MPDVHMRRIRLNGSAAASPGPVFSIVPSVVMPYQTGDVEAVEKALFLRRFGIPYWGLT